MGNGTVIEMRVGLEVKRGDLERVLKAISKLVKADQRRGEAVFIFSKGRLSIRIAGLVVHAEGEGILLTRVRVPVRWVIGLSRTLGPDDPVMMTVEGDYLLVGDVKVSCKRDHVEYGLLKLPLNPTFRDILKLRQLYPWDEIERSGLAGLVGEADARRDKLIANATEGLSPLGVIADEIRALVNDSL